LLAFMDKPVLSGALKGIPFVKLVVVSDHLRHSLAIRLSR
jgi:hypothetical protein